MTEKLYAWLVGMAAAAILCTAASELTPRGPVKEVMRLLCGVVMAAALLSPLLKLDYSAYSIDLARYRAAGEALAQSGEEISESYRRTFIEEQLEAYILDKAQTLGAEIGDAEVSARWSTDGVWYPVSAALSGPYHAALSDVIEAELGIPRERQSWSER